MTATVRERWERLWSRLDAEATASKSSNEAVVNLSYAYTLLQPDERPIIDELLAEWVLSFDEKKRFDALVLLREHKIVSAIPALHELAARLATSPDVGAPFELEKVSGVLVYLGGLPTNWTETKRFDEPPGWAFGVREVSNGVYMVTGRDRVGRQVEMTGTDPDALIERCRTSAMEMIAREQDQMNRTKLRYVLDSHGIDPEAYSLSGGHPNEKYAIEQGVGGWFVYYSERGKRTDEVFFGTEDAACRELLKRLTEDPTTRLMKSARYIELLQAIEEHLASFDDARWPLRLTEWIREFESAQNDRGSRVRHFERTRRALGGMGSIADVVIAPEAGHTIAPDEKLIKAANDNLHRLVQSLDKEVDRLLEREGLT